MFSRLRTFLIPLGQMTLMASFLAVPACRTPSWCPTRALRCVPQVADMAAPYYWSQSASPGAADSVPVSDSSPAAEQRRDALVQPTAYREPEDTTESANPFQLSPILPGADTPPLKVPRATDKELAESQRAEIFAELYPMITGAPYVPAAAPDEALGAMGLDQLQQLAREHHPSLRAAAAAVEGARGRMIQAGLPPNPQMGYQADTVRTAFTDGYHGGYIQQTIVTAQKLGLAAQAAAWDHANACLELQRTWYTVVSEVRRQYFHALTARQRLQLAEALSELSQRAYAAQIELVKAGEAAAYEPLQLRVLTTQARASIIQAQQESVAAWRALAAATGVPSMAAAPLEGNIECPVPEIDYEYAATHLLSTHTDVKIARNTICKERTLVELADRTPIPNIDVGVVLQRDYTFTPGTMTYNLMVGGEIPLFDRNQGNRIAKRADMAEACRRVTETENHLLARLAPAFARYEANRQLATSFRNDALRDQVRAYRGVYQRYHTDPTGISYNDIIVAQQTLAATLTQYLGILDAQWQGAVDVGELLQVNDIFALGPPEGQSIEVTANDSPPSLP